MSKFFKIGTLEDTLQLYAAAPDRNTAIRLAEALTGPMNPSRVKVAEIPAPPPGYKLTGQIPCLMEEDPDYDA